MPKGFREFKQKREDIRDFSLREMIIMPDLKAESDWSDSKIEFPIFEIPKKDDKKSIL